MTLRTEEWVLFLNYLGRKIVRIRIGKVLPEIEAEWLAAAILSHVKEDIGIVQSNYNLAAKLVDLWL